MIFSWQLAETNPHPDDDQDPILEESFIEGPLGDGTQISTMVAQTRHQNWNQNQIQFQIQYQISY